MNIKERAQRGEIEDQLYIGDVVESHYLNTELKDIIDYLTEDKVMEELVGNNTTISSDRILGRVEMGKLLVVELKSLALAKQKLRQPLENTPEEDTRETPLALEPEMSQPQMGGTI